MSKSGDTAQNPICIDDDTSKPKPAPQKLPKLTPEALYQRNLLIYTTLKHIKILARVVPGAPLTPAILQGELETAVQIIVTLRSHPYINLGYEKEMKIVRKAFQAKVNLLIEKLKWEGEEEVRRRKVETQGRTELRGGKEFGVEGG